MIEQISALNAIDKELIKGLSFPAESVIHDVELLGELRRKLERATALSNLMRNKSKIVFEDDEGIKVVETTIWATTPTSIVLKHGMTIPIRRIHNVVFF